jgi:hypothetical protein
MTALISKLQYKNYETGEFTAVSARTFEETIELIKIFPWSQQRENIIIDLTNPSITIEGKNKDYLKLALYFNQKYVLYYFNVKQQLFTKSFTNLQDGYKYINQFYKEEVFDTDDFKKEPTLLKKNSNHFITQDFKFKVTPSSARKYLLSTSGINFLFSLIVLAFIAIKGINQFNLFAILAILVAVFTIGGGIHLIFFFRYYKYVADKILILSKGNDEFFYGLINNPVKYNKNDILNYSTIRSRGSKNQFNGFAIVEILFKNGDAVKIPNLLLDYIHIERKLDKHLRVEINKFPFL